MELVDAYTGTPTLSATYPKFYKALQNAVTQNSYVGTCSVDRSPETAEVVLRVERNNSVLGILFYGEITLENVSQHQIHIDIKRLHEVSSAAHRYVLEFLIEWYTQNRKWPTKTEVLIKHLKFNDIHTILLNLERNDFMRVWHPTTKDAFCTLTVKGLSVCVPQEARHNLQDFLSAMRQIAELIIKSPDTDFIMWNQVTKLTGLADDDWLLIYTLLSNENHLGVINRDPEEKSGKIWVGDEFIGFHDVIDSGSYSIKRDQVYNADQDKKYLEIIGASAQDSLLIGSETPYKYDLFISYASEDIEIAKVVYSRAKEIGLIPFLDKSKSAIKYGDVWEKTIMQAIKDSREFTLIFTPRSERKPWVWIELGAMWISGRTITPVLIGKSEQELHKILKDRQVVEESEIDAYLTQVLERKVGNTV
ncbi:MAG: toll/interleukin-1 receptor domain-containing protein [Candidatus Marinimicrobia bacterium]|nr:toll/interleukin-1 receptor domain-containing protein [Candidatus Neomarinimicrobiota bacterium]